ncbi:MAG TPA: polysaccharide deacetylase family protein, partial [Candidatus Humimicrobiaceae bacterium]
SYTIKVTGAKPFTSYFIPIVGFHEVEPVIGNPIELSEGSFDALCATLKNYGYQTITFQDLLDYLDYGKSLPEKPVILSSDDGYQDIYTYAFPILKKYGYKMTVFLITNLIGNSEADRQTNIFDKDVSGIPVRPMLIWPEILAMSRYGCEFLSHTANHIRLGAASADQIINELTVSKNAIESHIGKQCVLFAWPYDNYSNSAASLISKAGYRGGVVYGGGIEDVRAIDLRKIRRVIINGYNDAANYIRLLNLQ